MAGKAATVDEYLAGFPAEVRKALEQLRAAIRKAAPQAEERISYSIAGYDYHGMLVYFAGWARHVGFYPASRTVFQAFKKELATYPQSKRGTVQFPLDRPLPLALIGRMVRYRLKENDERQALKAAARAKAEPKAKPKPAGRAFRKD